MKKGCNRTAVCLALMLAIFGSGAVRGFFCRDSEGIRQNYRAFHDAVEAAEDPHLAWAYLQELVPKLKELIGIAEKEMKNMFSEE